MLIVPQVRRSGSGALSGVPSEPRRTPLRASRGCAPGGAAGGRGRSEPGPARRRRERAGRVPGKGSPASAGRGLEMFGGFRVKPWEPQGCGDVCETRTVGASRVRGRGGSVAGFQEKVALVPALGRPAHALGPSGKGPPWASGTPGACFLCFIREARAGECLAPSPGLFLQVEKGGALPDVRFCAPLTASKMGPPFQPLPVNHLLLGSERGSPGRPAEGGRCARGSAAGRCLQAGEPSGRAAGAVRSHHEVFAPGPTAPWPLLHFGSTFSPPGPDCLDARGPDTAAGAGRLPYWFS